MIWMAIYTKPRCEKKASEYYTKIGVVNYYPYLKKTLKKNGKIKHVILPIIYGYLFIKMKNIDYVQINDNPYVNSLVRNLGKIAQISEEEMTLMKKYVGHSEYEESDAEFIEGKEIEITNGVLKGKKGEIVEKRNNHLLLFIKSLQITIKINLKKQMPIAV